MSTDASERFKTVLVNNNFHVTTARLLTFNLLLNEEPQTIAAIIKKANGSIDRVSIYRNLELFENLGIINRVYAGWKYKIELSDKFVPHHHHMSCLGCGETIDIKDEKHINEFIKSISAKYEFYPTRHQFEIDGYCKRCQAAKNSVDN